MIYNICKRVIERGAYNKEDMTAKLDVYLLFDRISESQYRDLINMMEGTANE